LHRPRADESEREALEAGETAAESHGSAVYVARLIKQS